MHLTNPLNMDSSGIEVLEVSRDIETYIDEKIKEHNFVGSEVPFYVADLDSVFEKHQRWTALLPRVTPFYAVKCNNTPAVLRTLSALGAGFDCASKREIEMVLSIGVAPDKIIYAHTTKPQSHIRYACAQGVDLMTFDCEEELLKISKEHPNARLVLRIAVDESTSQIKLNTKFGAPMADVEDLLKQARELNLNVTGVSFHVGSLCMNGLAFKKAIANARYVFDQANLAGFQLDLLDIGGGFTGSGLQKMAKAINEALDELFPADSGVRVIAEPGRYYVDSAFILALNVFAKKKTLSHRIREKGVLDPVMMYYMTDGLYGVFGTLKWYPEIIPYFLRPHKRVESSELTYRSVLWGPTCDSGDKIMEVQLPELNVGDWILVDNVGAYTITMSSDFNGFEKPSVYITVSAPVWKMLNLKSEM